MMETPAKNRLEFPRPGPSKRVPMSPSPRSLGGKGESLKSLGGWLAILAKFKTKLPTFFAADDRFQDQDADAVGNRLKQIGVPLTGKMVSYRTQESDDQFLRW